MREQREEIFNFRNTECQQIFHELTSNTSKLSETFLNDLPLQVQAKKWEKNLNTIDTLGMMKLTNILMDGCIEMKYLLLEKTFC